MSCYVQAWPVPLGTNPVILSRELTAEQAEERASQARKERKDNGQLKYVAVTVMQDRVVDQHPGLGT